MKLEFEATLRECGGLEAFIRLGKRKCRAMNRKLCLPGCDSKTSHPACVAIEGLGHLPAKVTIEFDQQ